MPLTNSSYRYIKSSDLPYYFSIYTLFYLYISIGMPILAILSRFSYNFLLSIVVPSKTRLCYWICLKYFSFTSFLMFSMNLLPFAFLGLGGELWLPSRSTCFCLRSKDSGESGRTPSPVYNGYWLARPYMYVSRSSDARPKLLLELLFCKLA